MRHLDCFVGSPSVALVEKHSVVLKPVDVLSNMHLSEKISV